MDVTPVTSGTAAVANALAVKTKIVPIVVCGLWTGGCITGLANLDLTGFGVDCGRGGVFVSTLLGQIGNNGT